MRPNLGYPTRALKLPEAGTVAALMLTAASPASAQAIVFDGGGDGSFAGAYVYQSLDITQNQVNGGF